MCVLEKMLVFFSKLSQNKHLSSWDDQGPYVYKGMVIKISNMLNLGQRVLQTYATSNKRTLKGLAIFLKAMAELLLRAML